MAQLLRPLHDRSLRALVDLERGLVSREIYVNEDIYHQELEQVFARAWLLIGHETLVPNPGDFFQSRMGEMQAKLADLEFTGGAGGGRVEVTLNGKGEARKIRIDPSLIDSGEADLLEDLILAAFNDAKGKQEQAVREKMSELTDGLPLPPGMQLPF